MKRTLLTCGALLIMGAPQIFAAVAMQLDLSVSGGPSCTIQVLDTSVINTIGTCGGLTETLTGGAHGQLEVDTTAPGAFGGFTVNDTLQGHDFVTVPQLQSMNQVQVANTSAAAGAQFTSFYTDTQVPTVAFAFGVTTTLNNLTGGAKTADFFAYNSPAEAIPATNLLGHVQLSGPSSSTYNVYPNTAPGTPYSLTSQIVVQFAKRGQSVTTNQQISAVNVPEPASAMLMGTMMLLTGMGLRRKLKRG